MTSLLTAGHLLTPSRVCADPWALEASLAVTEKYDDNIGMTETDETGDFVTSLLPGLRIYRVGSRFTMSTSYQANMEFYANNPQANGVSHLGYAEAVVIGLGSGLLQKAQFKVTDTFTSTERLADYPTGDAIIGNNGVLTPPTPTIRNSGTATFSTPLSETVQWEASYSKGFTNYKLAGLIDSAEQQVATNLTDQLTARTTLGASYTFTITNFDNPSGSSTGENPASHAGDASVNFVITPTMNVGLRAGVVYFTDSSELQTIGSASLNKQFEFAHALISYTRHFSSGSGLYGQPSIDDSVLAVLSRALGDRAHASITGSYDTSRSTGGGHGHAHSYGVGASADYTVTSWLHASVVYRHWAQQAVLDSIDPNTGDSSTMNVRDNSVAIRLNGTWEWGTPAPVDQPTTQEHGATP